MPVTVLTKASAKWPARRRINFTTESAELRLVLEAIQLPTRDTTAEVCPHETIQPDYFAQIPGVYRRTPGNCVCATCGEPLPLEWRGGKAREIEEPQDART